MRSLYKLWYVWVMLQSYVGIVSQKGLELFAAEQDETVRFLWRRLRRGRSKASCFWCVVADDGAKVVRDTMRAGLPQLALVLLNRVAFDAGHLLPGDADFARCHRTRRKA